MKPVSRNLSRNTMKRLLKDESFRRNSNSYFGCAGSPVFNSSSVRLCCSSFFPASANFPCDSQPLIILKLLNRAID